MNKRTFEPADHDRPLLSQQLAERGMRSDAWASTRRDILEIDAANALYPQYVDRASGAYVWDVDGNRYIDLVMGYGPVVLGHADPIVNEAVIAQLKRGVCMSPMWSPRQVELTELLVDVIPGAEHAYLLRSGSDATSAAVRLARIYTGRYKIAKWGYNGWHDWTAPRPAGVPPSTQEDTLKFAYNDLASLEVLFQQYPNQIACVIMMPFELTAPEPGFLQSVKDLAHRHGAVFILDEMRSGFRMSLGGAQEYFGVVGDMSTFSKAMSNGYTISAVVGQRDLLRGMCRSHMSSTFYGNAPEMAAALATISQLRDTDAIARLWSMGTRFVERLREIVARYQLPAQVLGYPIAPFLQFENSDQGALCKFRFFQKTIAGGVLLHPNHQWFLSAAHTPADIEAVLSICEDAAQNG